MIKGVLILLLLCGIMLIIYEFAKSDRTCPRQKVIYRYIPRTFEEEQNEPVYVSEIFQSLFSSPTEFVRGIGSYNYRKNERVNDFYISQQ